ncbi:hypothetical protein DITRI_Ditri17bG0080300 [Diplodiscus trichospermus]
MSALFNFHSFLTVVLLGICTCTYLKLQFPAILEQRTGFRGFFWKAARIVREELELVGDDILTERQMDGKTDEVEQQLSSFMSYYFQIRIRMLMLRLFCLACFGAALA